MDNLNLKPPKYLNVTMD